MFALESNHFQIPFFKRSKGFEDHCATVVKVLSLHCAAASSADPGPTLAPDASSPAADGQSAASTAAPGDVTSVSTNIQTDSQDDGASSSQSTVASVAEQTELNTTPVSTEEPQTIRIIVVGASLSHLYMVPLFLNFSVGDTPSASNKMNRKQAL